MAEFDSACGIEERRAVTAGVGRRKCDSRSGPSRLLVSMEYARRRARLTGHATTGYHHQSALLRLSESTGARRAGGLHGYDCVPTIKPTVVLRLA